MLETYACDRPARRHLALGCVFFSGICALVYQTMWLREFRLIFGASTPATAAVTAIFMGGLGVGSLLFAQRVGRAPRPFRLYAQLELVAALSAALTPWLLYLARQAYLALGGTPALGLTAGTVLRLLLAALVLALPTVALGGTLPAVVQALHSERDARCRRFAWLYGANTLGAVIGALLATFLLFEWLGNRLTLWAAAGLNLSVAGVAWWAARAWWAPGASPMAASRQNAADGRRHSGFGSPAAPLWLVLVAAGVAGFAFFLLELVWYRLLNPLLGGTTFTFGLILALALLGIALGSFLYSWLGRQRPVTLASLGWICAAEALCVVIPFALGDRLAMLAVALQPLGELGFAARVVAWSVLTGIVVFPASVLAGAQFPMLIALLGQARPGAGLHTGRVYAANTAGAIAGSLAGGFGILPWLTAPGAWRLVWVILVLLALGALAVSVQQTQAWRPLLGPGVLLVLTLGLGRADGPTAAWRHSPIGAGRVELQQATRNDYEEFLRARRRVLHWEAEGVESCVGVTREASLAFLVNGKTDGNARMDAPTQVMLGLLPALAHPAPTRSLVVGLGSGSSAGWLGVVPGMEQVEVLELEPAMIEVARMCAPVNADVLDNPKVRLWLGDAREYLLAGKDQYDLIVSEPSNPYRAGVASLFTREFYASVTRRLRPGGLFAQWVQGYEVDGETLSRVCATLASVFPAVDIWLTQQDDLLFVASSQPLVYDVGRMRQQMERAPFRTSIAAIWRMTDLEGVFGHFLANADLVRSVAATGLAPATDDANPLEFAFARTVGRKTGSQVSLLQDLARDFGCEQPLVTNGVLDWARVLDRRISAWVANGDQHFEAPPGAEPAHVRARAKAALVQNNYREAFRHWQRQEGEPQDLVELLLVAAGLAEHGDEAALPYIEQLRAWHPLEAEAVMTWYWWCRDEPDRALEQIERLLEAWRRNPWTEPRIIRHTLEVAWALVSQAKDPDWGRRLQQALEPPLAVYLLDLDRLALRLELAQRMDGPSNLRQTWTVLRAFEPNPPWTRDVLELRAQCYERLGDPLADRAARDLRQFEAAAARPFRIQAREATSAVAGEPVASPSPDVSPGGSGRMPGIAP